jgi:signal transduction histidine kinase
MIVSTHGKAHTARMPAQLDRWRWQHGAAAALYVAVVCGGSYWMHRHALRDAMRELDHRLLAGAASVRYVLADDFHDRATHPQAVTTEEDGRNIRELTRLAREGQFVYLYTAVYQADRVFLTASSASEEELAAQEEVRYFAPYDEAAHLNEATFAATNPLFVSYTDRWGSFRAAFVPGVSPGGRRFIAGAEVDLQYEQSLLRHKVLESVGFALLLLAGSWPFFQSYTRRMRRQAALVQATNDRLTREMAERKAMEKELIRAHNMEALGTLAGGVAHDFNNILAAILGHAELAQAAVGPDSPVADDLAEIRKAGDRAKGLTRQILTYARKSASAIHNVQVSLVAREVANLIKAVLPANIQLHLDLASSSCVRADPVSVHQILMNLCTNAVHAMTPGGGQLTLSLSDVQVVDPGPGPVARLVPGCFVRIVVADTGGGIPPEMLDSIFDPYFTTKGPGAGTGLGLAVVQGIVASHGGDIQVTSKLGEGAVFAVHLPAVACTLPTPAESGRREAELRGTERIVIVDDEPAVAQAGCRLLERLGYSVRRFSRAEAALEEIRRDPQQVDLVMRGRSSIG